MSNKSMGVPLDTESMFLTEKLLEVTSTFQIGVKIKKLRPDAIIPKRATQLSAGYDLHACMDEPIVFKGTTPDAVRVPTGIAIDMRPMLCAMVGLIFPRSGMSINHGMVLGNAVGVIDVDYQGEIIVAMTKRAMGSYIINPGDRIAQLVFMPIIVSPFIEVAEFESKTERGSGGFGSTGS
jgi:dUTP pyrophosphatase